jgi:hypothetical protein
MGLDTKTYWLTDRQSQCDFDFDFDSSIQLWVRKLEGKSLVIFSRFKDFVEENNTETNATGIDQLSKITWLICSPGFLCILQKQ